MPKDFYSDIVALLKTAGWERATGGKGSHEKWVHPTTGRVVIVPRSKSRHTANEILKQAGLTKSF
jgi:predicted RNA binding protein YcfA (HicA-like mRNA interferase family)